MKSLIIILAFVNLLACEKSSIKPGVSPRTKTYIDFLKNTEWVGVDDGNRSQYAKPADMNFHADSTVTIYSIFYLSNDNGVTFQNADSIKGKISKIDSTPDGSIHISINFPDIGGEQLMTITSRVSLTMAPADPGKTTINSRKYNLALFPAAGVALKATSWGGEPINKNDPIGSGYYYPDLSIISFNNSSSGNPEVTYTKHGIIVQQQTGADLGILKLSYQQIGARVYLYGYDEDYSWDMEIASRTGNYTDYRQGRIMKYIGILMPTGDKMLIDSRSKNARLPTYTQTQDTYGPPGITPVITKH